MLYLVSYDLKESEKDYNSLFEAIKGCSTQWWHYLESVWIINSKNSIDECNSLIKAQMSDKDFLFIVDITDKKYQGWLPSRAWEWIKSNIHG